MSKCIYTRLRHVKDDGLPAFYTPDFMGERINSLPLDKRGGLPWHYVLLAEPVLLEWQAKAARLAARLADRLDFARLRLQADASIHSRLI